MKLKVGDKIRVREDLETIIEKIELDKKDNKYLYWFKDKSGKLWYDTEFSIELLYRTEASSQKEMTCSCGKPSKIPLCKDCFDEGLKNV